MKKEFLPKALNGTSDLRVCLNINRGQMATEPHYHDCVEIIYVRRGAIRVFFDNGWHPLAQGELFFAPPGCIHRCVSSLDETEQVVIGFTDSLVCDENFAMQGIFCPYRSGAVSGGYVLASNALIGEQMERIFHMDTPTYPSAYFALCAAVLELYGHVYGAWEREGLLRTLNDSSPIILAIKEYVAGHFATQISARELAKGLNISYSYLAKLMIGEMGCSLGAYVMTCRIENAKKLLLSTQKSVAEIGYECGFASSSAFISRFKKLTGKTPLVFRKEIIM